MKSPTWLKPGLYGAVCGAVALAVIGFSWGGWVTGSSAKRMAADQSKVDVIAALTPICVDLSTRDPQLAERLVELKKASSYSRGDIILKAGWATMPGTTEGNRALAAACAAQLAT
ncbi:hypothetical protein [Inquilinus limosus]|uniref:hypothetical protein n=1 Tax=Inquilinus limosus TaxID=171674 RepID=UPI00047D4BE0|nr:hypothetical protein [Inquilinus limosus]